MSRACSCSVWQWQRVVVYVILHDYVNVRVCNLHNLHHTGHIENHKKHTADLQLQWNAPISGYPVAESIAEDRDKGVCKTH